MSPPGPVRQSAPPTPLSGRKEASRAELGDARRAAAARCARALAACVADRPSPVAEFGCGTGLGGVELARAGFACIDGFDSSDAMLRQAERRGVYRRLARLDAPVSACKAPSTC